MSYLSCFDKTKGLCMLNVWFCGIEQLDIKFGRRVPAQAFATDDCNIPH